MKTILKNNKGSAIILTLIVVTILSMLAISLHSYMITQLKFANMDENSIKAYLISKSGAQAYGQYLIKNPDNLSTSALLTYLTSNTAGTGTFQGNSFDISVTGLNSSNETVDLGSASRAKITATSTVDSTTKSAALIINIPESGNSVFDNAVFSNGDLDFTGSDGIYIHDGSMETAGTITYKVHDDETDILDDGYHATEGSTRTFPTPALPTGLTNTTFTGSGQTFSDNCNITNNISINNGTINFNTGSAGNIQKVIVNDLSCKGDINILGSGKLYLYVTGDFEIHTNGNCNYDGNEQNLVIFLCGSSSSFHQQAGPTFYGFIYGPEATVNIQSGNNATFGSIICNNFSGANNSELTYRQIGYLDDFPGLSSDFSIYGWTDN